jgi:hypothetical protein
MPKKVTYRSVEHQNEVEFDLFGDKMRDRPPEAKKNQQLPLFIGKIKEHLECILEKCGLQLWLMIDRLDEIFPRRSPLETRALRGLLRVLRIFESKTIRIKIFLRDDILDQIVEEKGFTALTHVVARRAKPLRWSEDEILCLIVRRLFAHRPLAEYLRISKERLPSAAYARQAFYKVFPQTVYRGERRISTVRWIYSRAADGRGVVTPRDVIDMIRNAIQHQQDNRAIRSRRFERVHFDIGGDSRRLSSDVKG